MVLKRQQVCNRQLKLLSDVSFKSFILIIADHIAYHFMPAQIKPKSFELRQNFYFLTKVDSSHDYVHVSVYVVTTSTTSTQTFHFQRALTMSVDSCTETRSTLSLSVL